MLAVFAGGSIDLGAIGHCEQIGLDDERDLEDRFELGLVEAGECSTTIGGLHLGCGNDLLVAVRILERAAIPAAQLVVERAGERDVDGGVALVDRGVDDETFGRRCRARNVAADPPTRTEVMSNSSAFKATDCTESDAVTSIDTVPEYEAEREIGFENEPIAARENGVWKAVRIVTHRMERTRGILPQ